MASMPVDGSKLHCTQGLVWLVQLVVSDNVMKSCDKMPEYFLNQLIHC